MVIRFYGYMVIWLYGYYLLTYCIRGVYGIIH